MRPGAGVGRGVSDLSVPLSVLDLSLVGEGSTPARRCANSIDLVRRVERLGYRRYWVAEHHNMPGIASSSPAVLLAHAGRGHVDDPPRLGRRDAAEPRAARRRRAVRDARGAAPRARRSRHRAGARHRPAHGPGAAPLDERLVQRGRVPRSSSPSCSATSTATFPEDHPYRQITATPGLGYQPDDLAARLERLQRAGRGAARPARSRSPTTSPATTPTRPSHAYRGAFRPSETLAEPYVMLGVAVVARRRPSERAAVARRARASCRSLRLRSGPPGPLPHARGGRRVRVHAARARRSAEGMDRVAHRRHARAPCAASSTSSPSAPGPTS